MPTKAKIDDSIFLELHSKGLNSAEIARYFNVSSAAVRSKALTLSRKHPDLELGFLKPTSKDNLPVDTRLALSLDRYMLENSSIQKNLAKLPIESSLDHLDHRSAVILKGLQILEKIQKIGNPQGQESPRNIQVNQITTLLTPSTPQKQKPQVVDVQ